MSPIIASTTQVIQNSFFSQTILSSRQTKVVILALAVIAAFGLILMVLCRRQQTGVLASPLSPSSTSSAGTSSTNPMSAQIEDPSQTEKRTDLVCNELPTTIASEIIGPTAIVPDGMSYVNAWYALYNNNTEVAQFYQANSEKLSPQEEMVSTSEKVARIFKEHPRNCYPLFYMEYEGGRKMKVHFCDFPKLDVYYYDQTYGIGAAQKALDNYNTVAPELRFDKNDSYRFSDLI